jgi:lambda family phage tail tape measure protein
MPTLAELQVNVDSTQAEKGATNLNSLADASAKVARALREQKAAQDSLNQSGPVGGGGSAGGGSAQKQVTDITTAIDNQVKKLQALDTQRTKLNQSGLKLGNPEEFQRLNRIIDSNIELVRRQGDATDRLAQQATREQRAKEQSAQADQRRLDQQARSVAQTEAAANRARMREQRDLDATLAGLSQQIKAQQDYNRTVEQLNRNRQPASAGGTGLSNAEYDTYVKLAAAKRDDQLATADNTRERERSERRIEAVTSSLGKAERAEVQYARSLRDLNDALQLGVVTTDQYNTKLQQVIDRRNKAVEAANSNAQAEERFAAQLRSVLVTYDPVLRAQQQYSESVGLLSTAFQQGKIGADQFNKALGDQRQALDQVKAAQSNSAESQANRYQQALDRLVPYNAQLRNLAEAERTLQQQQQAGKVVTEEQIRNHQRAVEAIKAERTEIERRTEASRRNSNSAKQDAAALRGLPAQFTDVVVSLQGGQAPLTVLLQQGGQIKDIFGGVVPALRAVGGALLQMINPATAAAAIFGTLAFSANSGANELLGFNKALALTQNTAGVSEGQFSQFRQTLDDTVGTASKAAEALTLIAGTGRIAGENFVVVAEAAIQFERATGTAISKTVEAFASLGKDPVEAAMRLDEQYKFLTSSILAQAQALVDQGKDYDATILLQRALAEETTKTATDVIAQAGYMERAWIAVKDAVSETADALLSIGRRDDAGDQLKAQQQLLERTTARLKEGNLLSSGLTDEEINNNPAVKYTKERIRVLQEEVDATQKVAAAKGESQRKEREAVLGQAAAQSYYVSSLDGVAAAERKLAVVRQNNEKIRAGATSANPLTASQEELIRNTERLALEKVKEAREKEAKKNAPKRTPVDTTELTEVRSDLKLIEAEYDGYYKRVTALGEANLVSDEATYYSQKAILEAQRKAVSDSYDSQISEIKSLLDNKKNSVSQNISLNNQLTKAEASRGVELEKLDAKQGALASKESGRIAERTRNVAAYKAALDAQVQAEVEAGQRAADNVGRGSRQGALASQLGDNDRTFAKEQRELARSLSDQNIDPVEYDEKLRDLKEAHNELTAQIISNDKDIQAANADWTNGFTAAVEDAQDAGLNFAGTINSSLTGAFNSAGDALAEFVTTGKLNFRSFALSVLADMAKIASQQAASGVLGTVLGLAGTAASAYFGGGANGLAAGSAGATSSAAGASAAGYGNTYYQAKGGAWSGGTQMFAQGGAFTNSVVTNPTSFGMANGARGVMGEAGAEAIVPLARTRNGDLGIRADLSGGGQQTSGGVLVNVYVTGEGTSSNTSGGNGAYDSFGAEIGAFVEQRVYKIINKETRPGGSLSAG